MSVTNVKSKWVDGNLIFETNDGTEICRLDGTNGVFRRANLVESLTTATASLTAAEHDDKYLTLNRAAGITVTLPAATGSGAHFRLIVGTTVTSNSYKIQVASASDVMTGMALLDQDTADTVVGFEAAADSDTITLNGSTTGGLKGAAIELIDIATGLWWVRITTDATGTEATPFSAAVS